MQRKWDAMCPCSKGLSPRSRNSCVGTSELVGYRVTAPTSKLWNTTTCSGIKRRIVIESPPVVPNSKISPSSDHLDTRFSETNCMFSVFRSERWQKEY